MPGTGRKNTTAAVVSRSNQNGQWIFRWPSSYEVDLPVGAYLGNAGQSGNSRLPAHGDEFGALLDRALAFAG